MFLTRKNSQSFINTSLEIASLKAIKRNSSKKFITDRMNFNWGIIWETFNPLILVAGWSLLFYLGIRGRNFDLAYFVFLLLFWFAFQQLVTKTINLDLPKFFKNKTKIGFLHIICAELFGNLVPLILRFVLLIFVLTFFNYELQFYHLLYGLTITLLLGFFYGIIQNSVFHSNTFLIEAHGYFLQALFLMSSILIPVTRLPEPIREVFLYNPLVHVNEWIKSATTGIIYDYIELSYAINFLITLAIISPIFIWRKNNKINQIIKDES
ncbi:MAG: hypothetical protein CMF89_04315 [Candidatus Marinimicrobia bacterium]|mgnify:CR=1 FL=1|nr:hypothetical protein [Candidatus Neomarinimicrobiota bacterium]|tara:strand:- start:12435 stop:13235 length:801 start_codon:yes stop_codon:yes gene_type:complete